jgi:hypothetical protein
MVGDDGAALAGTCLGCGEQVPAESAFCPRCGTRQDPDRPMPEDVPPGETERLRHSANAWLVTAMVVGAVVLFLLGVLVGVAAGGW